MAVKVMSIYSIACVLLVLCLAVLVRESNARPPWLAPGSGVFTESAECHTDLLAGLHIAVNAVKESTASDTMAYPAAKVLVGWHGTPALTTSSVGLLSPDELLDLCQRCAKLTKSKLAYPACCSTDLQARKWCSDYVYFGRGQYDFY